MHLDITKYLMKGNNPIMLHVSKMQSGQIVLFLQISIKTHPAFLEYIKTKQKII